MSLSSLSTSRSQIFVGKVDSGSLRLHSSPSPGRQSPGSPSPLKRKHSHMSVATPVSSATDVSELARARSLQAFPRRVTLPILPPYNADAEPVPGPPSPTATEIVDVDPEDYIRTSKAHGVKVRDFAYEEQKPGVSKTPEIWRNPFLALMAHDIHIRRPHNSNFDVSGKLLRRLLEVGLVTEEEAKKHWTENDWKKLRAYDARPYPFRIAIKRNKPSAKYRLAARLQFYGDPEPGDIPDEAIYMPEDVPDAWEGDDESDAVGKSLKRRRLNAEKKKAAGEESDSQPLPSSQWSEGSSQSSQAESQSQPLERSPTPTAVTYEVADGQDELISTPPITPIALPDAQSLNRTTSLAHIGSPAAGTSQENDNSTRTRSIKRTETFSMLMVR